MCLVLQQMHLLVLSTGTAAAAMPVSKTRTVRGGSFHQHIPYGCCATSTCTVTSLLLAACMSAAGSLEHTTLLVSAYIPGLSCSHEPLAGHGQLPRATTGLACPASGSPRTASAAAATAAATKAVIPRLSPTAPATQCSRAAVSDCAAAAGHSAGQTSVKLVSAAAGFEQQGLRCDRALAGKA
jgi:hypothetical protein